MSRGWSKRERGVLPKGIPEKSLEVFCGFHCLNHGNNGGKSKGKSLPRLTRFGWRQADRYWHTCVVVLRERFRGMHVRSTALSRASRADSTEPQPWLPCLSGMWKVLLYVRNVVKGDDHRNVKSSQGWCNPNPKKYLAAGGTI